MNTQYSFAGRIQAIVEKSQSQHWFRLRRWHGLSQQPGLVFVMAFSAAFTTLMFAWRPLPWPSTEIVNSAPNESSVSFALKSSSIASVIPLGRYGMGLSDGLNHYTRPSQSHE